MQAVCFCRSAEIIERRRSTADPPSPLMAKHSHMAARCCPPDSFRLTDELDRGTRV